MATETLAEAGDADTDRAAEIEQLRAMYGADVPEFGPGELQLTALRRQNASPYAGHLALTRRQIRPTKAGPEVYLG